MRSYVPFASRGQSTFLESYADVNITISLMKIQCWDDHILELGLTTNRFVGRSQLRPGHYPKQGVTVLEV